jgi:hypothetical protein
MDEQKLWRVRTSSEVKLPSLTHYVESLCYYNSIIKHVDRYTVRDITDGNRSNLCCCCCYMWLYRSYERTLKINKNIEKVQLHGPECKTVRILTTKAP